MVGKIKASLDARKNENTVIIARTDARAVEGLDAALTEPLLTEMRVLIFCSVKRRSH